jgi:ABC-type transport system involved in multi-copper enzyme maturation permease subunit
MNPVLRKDLLGLLRLKRMAAIQVCFVAVLALLVLGTWPQGGVVSGTVTIAPPTRGGGLSDNLMLGLVLGQLVLLVLLVPGVAAVAITSEREAGTLEMLYASRLSALQIILGKIGLAIAYPVLLLISGLPFVALLAWRGEMRADQLALAYTILVIAAIYLTVLSLAISAMCRQGATSLVIAYVAILAVCGGTLVPAAIMLDGANAMTAPVLHYLRAFSPIAAAMSILKPRMNDFAGIERHMASLHSVFVPLALLVIAASIGMVVAKLRKPPSNLEGFGAPKSGTDAKRTIFRRLLFIIDPSARRKPLGRGNPVVGKERRSSNLRSSSWMIRIFYASLFLSLTLAGMALYGGTEHPDLMRYVMQILLSLQIALITLVVPSLSTGCISSELENGTFEVLRLTPLSGGQIFWGKLIPAMIPAFLPIIALVPAYGALCIIDPQYVAYLVPMAPVLLLAVVAMCILGLTCSAWAASTARATVMAYLIAASFVVLPMLLWWLAQGGLISTGSAKWVAFLSPLVMCMNLLPSPIQGDAFQSQINLLRDGHLMAMGGLCLVMLVMARLRLAAMLRRG